MVKYFLSLILLLPSTIGAESPFPTYVRVGKHNYKIHYVAELQTDEGEKLLGMCDLRNKQIYIKMPDPEIESTIVHEFIHAMVYENGFDMDEKNVLKMESALYRFLKDNYKLKDQ